MRLKLTTSSLDTPESELDSFKHKLIPTIDKHTAKVFVSEAAFCILDIVFHCFCLRSNIYFPSSVVVCAFIFCTLLAFPGKTSESTFNQITPVEDLFVKWLPILFETSLVTLPLAKSMGASSELIKAGIVIVGGFVFTLLTTAWIILEVQKYRTGININDYFPADLI